jgi:hypothetical protein
MNPTPYNPSAVGGQAEFRECFKCKRESVTSNTRCPRCGRAMHTAHDIRIRGVVMFFLGLFMAGLVAGIAVLVAVLLAGAMKNPDSAKKINHQQGMLLLVATIFALLIGFGLNSMVGGAWQMIFGRRNHVLIWVMWGLLIFTYLVGIIFQTLA